MDFKLSKEFVIISVNAALMEHCIVGNSILEIACERESQRSTSTSMYCATEDKILGYFALNISFRSRSKDVSSLPFEEMRCVLELFALSHVVFTLVRKVCFQATAF